MSSTRMVSLAACGWCLLFSLTSRAQERPVEIISPEFHGALQPQVAVDEKGQVFVAFGKENSIYCVASRDGGKTFAKPKRVGSVPANLALGMRRGPRITATRGRLAISAISHGDGDLRVWTSDDGGASWPQPLRVNEVAKSAREGMHAMASGAAGQVAVVWLDLRSGGMELWSAVSENGGKSWGRNTRVYQSPDGHICECCHPSVAINARGEISAMWRNWLGGSRDMYLAVSRDRGESFAPATKLGTGTWKLDGCPMDGGAFTFDTSGQPLTVWRREGAILSSGGSDETQLSKNGRHPVVTQSGSTTHRFWQEPTGLMWQRGTAPPHLLDQAGVFVSAASLPDGSGLIAVWESQKLKAITLLAQVLNITERG